MGNLTAEDFQKHLSQVVDPKILGQVSLEDRKVACDCMAEALAPKPHAARETGHSR